MNVWGRGERGSRQKGAQAEGRRHPRARLAWPAVLRAGTRLHRTETVNLSPFGAKVALRQGVEVGASVRLHLRPPALTPVEVDGIVWRRDRDGLAIVFLSMGGATPAVSRALAEACRLPEGRGERGATVLLVEEDAQAGRLARGALEADGYAVLDAGGDPREAARLAAAHPGAIHLLVADVATSAVNGLHLLEQLAPQQPGMNVLFVSAHRVGGRPLEGLHFLAKPFTAAGLVAKVRGLLGGRAHFERRRRPPGR